MVPIEEAGGFGPGGDEWEPDLCREVVLVTGADRAAVTRAMRRAAPRLMRMTEDGRELATDEEVERAAEQDVYTPNYVSDPEQLARGVGLYVDCKGAMPPEMGALARRVLVEELERYGVADARFEVPTEDDDATAETGLFDAAGVPWARLTHGPEVAVVLAALAEHLEGAPQLVLGWGLHEPVDGVEDVTDRCELAWLGPGPGPVVRLDPPTVAALAAADAARHGSVLSGPLWVVRGEDVLVHVPVAQHRVPVVRKDLEEGALRALARLRTPPG